MFNLRSISAATLLSILLLYGISHTLHLAMMHTEPAQMCVAVGNRHFHDFNVDCRLCHWISSAFTYTAEAVLVPIYGKPLAELSWEVDTAYILHLILRCQRGPPVS